MRILLLQARHTDDPALAEEVLSFAAACGLEPGAFEAHDLLTGSPDAGELGRFDALMVGGNGEFYVTRGDVPHLAATLEFLGVVVDRGFPTFASCFGYQCLVMALGGELIHDPEAMELGTYDLRLTPAGRADELFSSLPREFAAQLGHKDRARSAPADTLNLAESDLCPLQALRVPGKPIWASQFHPELDREANFGRFRRYLTDYATSLSPEELAAAAERFRESRDVSRLLPRFLELIAG